MPDPVSSHTAAEHRQAVSSLKGQPSQAAGHSGDPPTGTRDRTSTPSVLAPPSSFRAICARPRSGSCDDAGRWPLNDGVVTGGSRVQAWMSSWIAVGAAQDAALPILVPAYVIAVTGSASYSGVVMGVVMVTGASGPTLGRLADRHHAHRAVLVPRLVRPRARVRRVRTLVGA